MLAENSTHLSVLVIGIKIIQDGYCEKIRVGYMCIVNFVLIYKL